MKVLFSKRPSNVLIVIKSRFKISLDTSQKSIDQYYNAVSFPIIYDQPNASLCLTNIIIKFADRDCTSLLFTNIFLFNILLSEQYFL